jgi:extradiol dioxygenase family protein
MYTRLKDRGVEFVSPPITVDAGANVGMKALYLRDPDGFTIELFEPKTNPAGA